MTTSDRHPATVGLLRWFEFGHLPEHLQAVSRPVGELAHAMVDELADGAELSVGLRKLLEAKDAFVRAALEGVQTREASAPALAPAGPTPFSTIPAPTPFGVDRPLVSRCPFRVQYVGDPFGSRAVWLECSAPDGHEGVHGTADGLTFE